MNIPTANVILAFSKDVIDKLKADGSQYQSLVRDLNKETVEKGLLLSENFLVFNNTGNPNFISFEHSFQNGKALFKLSFIDPKREFEERFFDTSLKNNIGAYFDSEQYKNLVNEEKKQETGKDFLPQELQTAEIDSFVKDIKDTFGTRKFYIFYGIGNDLDNWAGPYKCELVGSKLDLDGSRKITLNFAPLANDLGNNINLNLLGARSFCTGTSQEITLSGIFSNKNLYNPVEKLSLLSKANLNNNISNKIENYYKSYDKQYISKIDIHALVVDTIRNYIQKATGNSNVIVLLPDLNLVCTEAIQDIVDRNLKRSVSTESVLPSEWESLNNTKAIRDTYFDKLELLTQETISFLKDLSELFNLKYIIRRKSPEDRVYNWIDSLYEYKKDYYTDLAELEHKFSIQGSTDGVLPDHKKNINDVLRNIVHYAKNSYPITLRYISESSTDLLDFWAKSSEGSYLFGGYQNFSNNKGAIIVGDESLIKNYLYGFHNLNDDLENIQTLKTKKQELLDSYKGIDPVDETGFIDTTLLQDAFNEIKKIQDKINELEVPQLHPLDRSVLINKKYNKEIRKLVIPKQKTKGSLNSVFGKQTYIPDDFGYLDKKFTEEEKDLITKNNIPVFKYNTKNPNILNLTFNSNNIYFSLLNLAFEKSVTRQAITGIGGELTEGFGDFKSPNLASIILHALRSGYSEGMSKQDRWALQQAIVSKLPSQALEERFDGQRISKYQVGYNEYVFASAIISLLDLISKKDGNNTIVEIEQSLQGGPIDAMMDIIKQLYKFAFQVRIKTLPTFEISKTLGGTIGSNCIVLAQDTPIMGINKKLGSNLSNFVTGIYTIVGFKHIINNRSCESEFDIIKTFANTEE